MSFLYLFISLCFAQIEIPLQSSSIVDEAKFFQAKQLESLNNRIDALYEKRKVEIKILTLNELIDGTIEDYAIATQSEWKLEQKNSLLFVISKKERKIKMLSSESLKKVLTEQQLSQILIEDISPSFKEDKYYDGVNSALIAISGKFKIRPSKKEGPSKAFFISLKKEIRGKNLYFLNVFVLMLLIYPFYNRIFGRGRFTKALFFGLNGFLLYYFLCQFVNYTYALIAFAIGFTFGFMGFHQVISMALLESSKSKLKFKGHFISGRWS
jgi:uncharacterized protein